MIDAIKLIGHWRNAQHPEYPDPHELIDANWQQDDVTRWVLTGWLQSGTVTKVYMGLSPCRICGEPNGSREFTDWTYAWPEGLAHYVEVHAVRLPEAFVQHVMSQSDALEGVHFGLDWWLEATS